MSWTIGNKEVQSLHIGNKEVQSIVRVSDSKVLYEKPVSYSISLVADKYTANTGETVTFTATVTNGSGSPVVGETVTFKEGANVLGTGVTNASGICSVSYSWNYTNTLNIKAIYDNVESNSVNIEIKQPLTLTFTGSQFTPYNSSSNYGLIGSNMSIDWGDGTSESITSNTKLPSHTYSTNGTYVIKVTGGITSLGAYCFRSCTGLTDVTIPNSVTSLGAYCFGSCYGLTNITIPSSVTSLGNSCFYNCTRLTDITIPSSVTSLGSYCFYYCDKLINYQLYWQTPPAIWTKYIMPNNTNTYFTIPNGTTANYVAKSFPSAKLIERSA